MVTLIMVVKWMMNILNGRPFREPSISISNLIYLYVTVNQPNALNYLFMLFLRI